MAPNRSRFYYGKKFTEVQLDHERGNSTFNNRRISSFLNSSHVADTEIELSNPNEYNDDDPNMEMIYHEAAIFLEVIIPLDYLQNVFKVLLIVINFDSRRVKIMKNLILILTKVKHYHRIY